LTGEPVYPAGNAHLFAVEKRPSDLRGFAALKYLWETYLIPLADEMAPGVRAAVDEFAPHVVVADQQALAGAVVSVGLGIPWATSASTPTELAVPTYPRIAAWITGLLHELCDRHDAPAADLRFSPRLILAFTTRELAGPPAPELESAVRYLGVPAAEPSKVDFPWHRLDGRPLVLITLGTANAEAGRRFLTEGVAALASMSEVQGVVAGDVQNDEVLVVERIPQVELLRRAAVVVCHGGQNTVSESLHAGVPLVVAPIRDDQSMLAQQVVEAGAGLRLRFDRAGADDLRKAITSLLTRPHFARNAARIRASYLAAGGAALAAQLLVQEGQPCNPMSR
jgi:MGT family glycosyltransferase